MVFAGCSGEDLDHGSIPQQRAEALTPATFPLVRSSNARVLQDANGVPFPILGRAAWFVLSLSSADQTTFISDSTSRGYNAFEFIAITHDSRANHAPRDGANNLPFTKRLDGGAWSGALTYSNIAAEAPDFTTPNEPYWRNVDAFVATCQQQGILLFMFPSYVGFANTPQGWMQEMVANGPTRMQQYGSFIANRYKTSPNLVWMMGGDQGSFSSSQDPVERALRTGLDSVSGQASKFFSAEWSSGMIGTDQQSYGAMTLNSVYSFEGDVPNLAKKAYGFSPTEPAFLLEEPYDEEGPDGNGVNANATQPVRRFQWWGVLGTIGGYISGNGFVWPFNAGWQNHLDTQGSRDMARLNAFLRSIAWQNLVPTGLGGMKTLVTAGASTPSAPDYVGAAATPDGSLLVAYVPPAHTGTITIDMTAMASGKSSRARWFNPTDATYTAIATIPNSGTHTFTPPASNGTSFDDWVLVLDVLTGTPPNVTTPASATPNPVTGTTTNVSVQGDQANLTYTWTATGPGAVTFAPNATTSSSQSIATFTKAGSYVLTADLVTAQGGDATSSVNVTVNQTLSSTGISPQAASVPTGGTLQFSASTLDQFAQPMASQPAFSWQVSGGGTISSAGLFTAGSTTGGPFTITATSGARSASTTVTVVTQTLTIGEKGPFTTGDDGNANLVLAQPAVLSQAATLQSLSFQVTAAAGILRLGVYDSDTSGNPHNLIAHTNDFTPSVGSNTTPVTQPIVLQPGTYWLAYEPSDNGLQFLKGGTTGARFFSVAQYGSSFPSAFATNPQSTVDHWELWATLTPTSGGAPVLTSITISPSSATVAAGAMQSFTATGKDQNGVALTPQPTFTWSVTGGGTIDASGLFTAGSTAGGPFTVKASASGVSGTASVTNSGPPSDTQPPSVPANVTATAASSTSANVTWSASTDNVGTTGYIVLRCTGASCTPTAQVATPPSTSFSDTGLAPATTYRYAVQARDAAGNKSASSAIASATTPAQATPIQFVQVNAATPQAATPSVSVAFTTAQVAGHFNIVVIGWSGTTESISSVVDSNGNVYQVAIGPTRSAGFSQAIYFAPNVKAGGNTVTVSFSTAVEFPDVRILEYSGLSATATVNQSSGSFGSTATASAGPVSTNAPGQLVFAAGTTAWAFSGAAGGFTTRIITQPDTNIAQDLVAATAGSYTATANLTQAAEWVMQVVSFH